MIAPLDLDFDRELMLQPVRFGVVPVCVVPIVMAVLYQIVDWWRGLQ